MWNQGIILGIDGRARPGKQRGTPHVLPHQVESGLALVRANRLRTTVPPVTVVQVAGLQSGTESWWGWTSGERSSVGRGPPIWPSSRLKTHFTMLATLCAVRALGPEGRDLEVWTSNRGVLAHLGFGKHPPRFRCLYLTEWTRVTLMDSQAFGIGITVRLVSKLDVAGVQDAICIERFGS